MRRKLCVTMTTAALVASGTIMPSSASASHRAAPVAAKAAARTHIYLVPHQDDEVLSMSAAIRRSITTVGAKNVHLVLATTGGASGARKSWALGVRPLGSKTFATAAFTRTQLGAARDLEFKAAARKLAVPAQNVHLSLPRWKRVAESFTTSQARSFVNASIDRFGTNAAYFSMSDRDPSTDHRRIGAALRSEGKRRKVNDATYFYPQYQLPAPIKLTHVPARTAVDRRHIIAAANEYGVYRPSANRWALGWTSVPAAFGGAALTMAQVRSSGLVWTARKYQAPRAGLLARQSSFTHK